MLVRPELHLGLVDRNTLLGRLTQIRNQLNHLGYGLDIRMVLLTGLFERFQDIRQ